MEKLKIIKYYLFKKLAHYYFFRLGKIITKFYTLTMSNTGKNIYIFSPFHCTSPEGIKLGNNVNISYNCMIGGEGGVLIGNFVMVGPNSCILSSNHGYGQGNIPMLRQKPVAEPVTIEDDVWIGANVIILPGISIGQGSIIGASTIVTESIPPYSIAVGNPAKIIKKRFSSKQIAHLLSENSPLYEYYKNDYLQTDKPTIHFNNKQDNSW